ncbi:DUF3558 domain-containing protein [Rhodococcus sp. PAMC28707]|uniref:DUF3558 domain-containing protein n=1 Tax=unclassified Rhodococcus (in: high G+C Gram-positive bacteria) TaxID=192944 RepID=UPI00109DDD90|nr:MULTISPECIES: DUF3558 domain-containing protein [unclassified Rhodococcus (in: high G+C Gram-positive bacteria)]QCB52024.1 DUF3558 domain-containing protein [Rhodococcus sp. PAMC28705]QCB59808.1 DUF3558 domain-containing protein [Rhodococcus sp. PAMC28707]
MQRRWLPLLAVAAVLTACSQPVEGVAVAGVPGQAEQFEPCSIPDDAIAATGLKPETGSGWLEGMTAKAWTVCGWDGPIKNAWYHFDVLFSVQFTLNDVRQNPAFQDVKEVSLDGRPALEYGFANRSPAGSCGSSFDTIEGVAMLSVDVLGTGPPQGDPCEIVHRHTTELRQYFPPSI